MKICSFILPICLMLAFSVFTGSVSGEDTSLTLVSLSGNSSVLTMDANGTYQVTVNDMKQNVIVPERNLTSSLSVNDVISVKNIIAAVVLSKPDRNETVSIVQISDPMYSVKNQTLSATLTPQQFYDGTLLKDISENRSELKPGTYGTTFLNLECNLPVLNSWHDNTDPTGGTK